VHATAAEGLTHGAGSCQDPAHVFVAAARLLGVPARYVGGYLCRGSERDPDAAAHAWAEAYHPDLGWIAFDAVTGGRPGERHVPCAVGLDSFDAAAVRRVRPAMLDSEHGAGAEVQQQ
jgi:transglutaminase-like putative cysteine protease